MTDAVGQTAAILAGACVGSFLNVVIFRLPQGTFLSAGRRSRCPGCGARIPWYFNLPILGWLLLRGRAACCGKPVSVRYPLVEALTAAAFWLLWVHPPSGVAVDLRALSATGLGCFLLHAYFVATLIACTFIDIDHRLLPDLLTKPAMVVGIGAALLLPEAYGSLGVAALTPSANAALFAGAGAAAGSGLTAAVRWLAGHLFRQEAMGRGDIKFMGAIGAFLGWKYTLLTFFLGCLLGAVGGILHRIVTGDAFIFFGPFLAAGAAIMLFAGGRVDDFVFVTWPRWQQSSQVGPIMMVTLAAIGLVLLFFIVRRGRSP